MDVSVIVLKGATSLAQSHKLRKRLQRSSGIISKSDLYQKRRRINRLYVP